MNSSNTSPHVHIRPFLEADSNQKLALNQEKFPETPPLIPTLAHNHEEPIFSPTHSQSPKRKSGIFNIKRHSEEIRKEEKELPKKGNVLVLIKKWKDNMVSFLKDRNLLKLTRYHHFILKEFSSDNENDPKENYEKNNFFISLVLKVMVFLFGLLKIPVLAPNNKWKIFWDFSILLLLFIHFYFLIFNICLEINPGEKKYYTFYDDWVLAILPVFSFDMIQKINAGYFRNGLQILDRKSIIQHYFKKEFLYDFLALSSLILDLLFLSSTNESGYHSLTKALFLFKIPILKEMIRNLEEVINFDEKIITLISLFKLSMKMLFFAHVMACIWFCIPRLNSESNWMQFKGIENMPILIKYEYSLYWAFVTIATIGYGDITPQNHFEILFTMISVILGSIFFGYSLNFISSIFSDLDKEETKTKENLQNLNRYLKKNGIDFHTQLEIKKYMNFLWEIEKKQTSEKENEIFHMLTPNLQEKILQQTYGKVLFSIPLFKKNFSKNFLFKLLPKMQPINFDPNSIIYQKGEFDKLGIYILDRGEVALTYNPESNGEYSQENHIKIFKKGDVFGEIEFFSDKERLFSAKSVSYSSAYVIYLDEFKELLKSHQEDLETYFFIKDKILFMNDFKDLSKPICYSCNQNTHFIVDCPLLLPINKKFLLSKSNFSQPQIRKSFKRRINKSNTFYIPKNDHEAHDFDEFDPIENNESQEISREISDQKLYNEEDDYSIIHHESPASFLKNASKMLRTESKISIEEEKKDDKNEIIEKDFIEENQNQINMKFSQREDLEIGEKNAGLEKNVLDLHQKSLKLQLYSTSIQPSIIKENQENIMKKSLDINETTFSDKNKINKYQHWKSNNMSSINSLTMSAMQFNLSASLHKINISTKEILTDIYYLFDKMNNYQNYFSNGNFPNVINRINKNNINSMFNLKKGLALKSKYRIADFNKKLQSIFNKVRKKHMLDKKPNKSLKDTQI